MEWLFQIASQEGPDPPPTEASGIDPPLPCTLHCYWCWGKVLPCSGVQLGEHNRAQDAHTPRWQVIPPLPGKAKVLRQGQYRLRPFAHVNVDVSPDVPRTSPPTPLLDTLVPTCWELLPGVAGSCYAVTRLSPELDSSLPLRNQWVKDTRHMDCLVATSTQRSAGGSFVR